MSADNGIYIGRFKHVECSRPLVDEGGAYYDVETGEYEYRVIHAQSIENCDYADDFPKEVTDAYRALYYGNDVAVYKTSEEAYKHAGELAKLEPILEYGISWIQYDVPFPEYIADPNEVIKKYWNGQEAAEKKEREKDVAVKCLVTKGMMRHEYQVMVQDYPSLTPVVWRGWVDEHQVRINTHPKNAGMTMEGHHFGELHARKIKEEVREVGYNTTVLQYLIEFPDGIPSHSVWVEPRLVEGTW